MRDQYAMRAVCEIEGEGLEPVRNFQARESVRVSLALKFADVTKMRSAQAFQPAVAVRFMSSAPHFDARSAPPSESSERTS
jgi:hypothetical protein